MVDPGVYYNLKAAKEIMRKQTDKATFSKEDVALKRRIKNKLIVLTRRNEG